MIIPLLKLNGKLNVLSYNVESYSVFASSNNLYTLYTVYNDDDSPVAAPHKALLVAFRIYKPPGKALLEVHVSISTYTSDIFLKATFNRRAQCKN